MHLKGSCHCGKVKFRVESAEPVPFMRCYCSICRKTAGTGGTGGYAINLGAVARRMPVEAARFGARRDEKLAAARGAGCRRGRIGACVGAAAGADDNDEAQRDRDRAGLSPEQHAILIMSHGRGSSLSI